MTKPPGAGEYYLAMLKSPPPTSISTKSHSRTPKSPSSVASSPRSPAKKPDLSVIDISSLSIDEAEATVWGRMQSYSEAHGRLRGLDLFRLFLKQNTPDRSKLDEDDFAAALGFLNFANVTPEFVKEIMKRTDPGGCLSPRSKGEGGEGAKKKGTPGRLPKKQQIEYQKFVQSIANRDRNLAKAVEERAAVHQTEENSTLLSFVHAACHENEENLKASIERLMAALEEANETLADADTKMAEVESKAQQAIDENNKRAAEIENNLKRELARALSHIEELEPQLKVLMQENASLKQKLSETSDLLHKADETLKDELVKKAAAKKKTSQAFKRADGMLKEEMAHFRTADLAHKDEVTALEAELERLRQELEGSETKIEAAEMTHKSDLKSLQAEIKTLKEGAKRSEAKFEAAELAHKDEVAALEVEISRLKEGLPSLGDIEVPQDPPTDQGDFDVSGHQYRFLA